MPAPKDDAGRRTYELDRAHVFHSWSAQAALDPMVVTRSEGSYLWDADGARYLDFSGQLVYTNVGHQHPRVVKAIQDQAATLCTIAPAHANDKRALAAKLITDRAPEGMNKVFFTNGGADAVEHAVRMARLHTGRYKVLTQYRGYHGGTHLTINMSGDHRRWPNDNGTAGTVHFWGPFLYRSAFHATTEAEECERALEHLEQLIRFEGPESFAALVLETVAGTSGVMPPPPGYLQGVREICDRYGIVYVADEVMVGFGRTGTWFAVEQHGVTPDLITFAKGVNSGYVPLGGVIIGDHIAETFAHRVYPGGLTYSGHPLATAAAVATIEAMADEKIVENAAEIGRTVLGPGLRALAERHPSIGEVRGVGAFWALDLVTDRETKEPLAPYGGSSPAIQAVLAEAKAQGLLVFTNYHRIHLAPPLNVTEAEVKDALTALDVALAHADAVYTGAPIA
ncbi:taurine--2-oxoglutarate transaminase [Sediminihabitans luteus]|uniref:Taurine--2-oxoglutarate transaminase n=1 Tax=Sediminihabitans luteus TaxID=1138585 RepID=A0A2M9D190_9CELL|nr:aspartate aminotransferase family protein [Sediminihabitans luteus]PJJ77843.1 taurine--2-oxoglutarate transaminase [Sediminihabitans luteus]GII99799.1 aspartate aminotransferase family protein [Sediminihabitans luteus]